MTTNLSGRNHDGEEIQIQLDDDDDGVSELIKGCPWTISHKVGGGDGFEGFTVALETICYFYVNVFTHSMVTFKAQLRNFVQWLRVTGSCVDR